MNALNPSHNLHNAMFLDRINFTATLKLNNSAFGMIYRMYVKKFL